MKVNLAQTSPALPRNLNFYFDGGGNVWNLAGSFDFNFFHVIPQSGKRLGQIDNSIFSGFHVLAP